MQHQNWVVGASVVGLLGCWVVFVIDDVAGWTHRKRPLSFYHAAPGCAAMADSKRFLKALSGKEKCAVDLGSAATAEEMVVVQKFLKKFDAYEESIRFLSVVAQVKGFLSSFDFSFCFS